EEVDAAEPHGLVAQLVTGPGQVPARAGDPGHRAAGTHDDLAVLDLDFTRVVEAGLLPAVEALAVEEDDRLGPAGRLVPGALAGRHHGDEQANGPGGDCPSRGRAQGGRAGAREGAGAPR